MSSRHPRHHGSAKRPACAILPRPAPTGEAIRSLQLAGMEARYRLRFDRRSRHIRIRLGLTPEIQVSAPPGTPIRAVEAALRAHTPWLEAKGGLACATGLASGVDLPFAGTPRRLELEPAGPPAIRLKGTTLHVRGAPQDDAALRPRLTRWYRTQAARTLPERLSELAERTGLNPERVSIRNQRTRWGSCSARGAINLNWRLVMLPPALADHVMIHELCHLRHLDHSRRFWALVARHDPDHRSHRTALRAFRSPL